MAQSPSTDEQLLRDGRLGEAPSARRRAFERLFLQYQKQVAMWCLRFTGDREAAADLAQDVFLKAYSSLGNFRGAAKFSTWLYTITRNHCLNYARSAERRHQLNREELSDQLVDRKAPDPRQSAEIKSEIRHARQLMCKVLSPVERQVLTLRYAEELPVKTVTRLLGLGNQSGAKAYLVSAKRKLASAIARQERREAARAERSAGRRL